jgi:hypothetical protein
VVIMNQCSVPLNVACTKLPDVERESAVAQVFALARSEEATINMAKRRKRLACAVLCCAVLC